MTVLCVLNIGGTMQQFYVEVPVEHRLVHLLSSGLHLPSSCIVENFSVIPLHSCHNKYLSVVCFFAMTLGLIGKT